MSLLAAFVLAVGAGQGFVLGQAWLGAWAPDLAVPLAAWLALRAPRGKLAVGAALLGWVRAAVLVEPAGGQVLAALAAMAVVAGLRRHLVEIPAALAWVLAVLLLAGLWSAAATLLGAVAGVPLSGGRELVLGALAGLPLALLVRRLEPAR